MIKPSTRVFAWACIVILELLLVWRLFDTSYEGDRVKDMVILAVLMAGWGLVLVHALSGWWFLVLMHVYKIADYLWQTAFPPYFGLAIHPPSCVTIAIMETILAIPLIVLVLDSPWRWRRVREAERAEG